MGGGGAVSDFETHGLGQWCCEVVLAYVKQSSLTTDGQNEKHLNH